MACFPFNLQRAHLHVKSLVPRFSLGGIVAFTGLAASPTLASPIIDQQQLASIGSVSFTDGAALGGVAQTFTVGISGQLTSIGLRLGVTGPLTELLVLSANGGIPTFNILATSTAISQAPVNACCQPPGPTTFFDLMASNLMVAPGDVLAFEPIMLSSSSGENSMEFFGGFADAYSGGGLFFFNPPGQDDWLPFASPYYPAFYPEEMTDAVFETFVSPVPEPLSVSLFGAGLFSVAALRRRKTKYT